MTTYTAGGLVTSTATFSAEPTTITLKVSVGSSGVTTYVYPNAFITLVSAGPPAVYTAEIDTTGQSGPMTLEWIGTGACQAIGYTTDTVTPAPL